MPELPEVETMARDLAPLVAQDVQTSGAVTSRLSLTVSAGRIR